MAEWTDLERDGLTLRCAERLLVERGVSHCFTTRAGGASEGVYRSLNLGRSNGDRPEHVRENYRRLGLALGFDDRAMARTDQMHGDRVRMVTAPDGDVYAPVPEGYDALITDRPGVPLVAYMADCVPVLLYHPGRKVAAAIHAGWRGTALGIVAKTVRALERVYGAEPSGLLAAIGPAIEQSCYECDEEVHRALKDAFGNTEGLIETRGEKCYPDLKGLNALWLRRAGVREIAVSHECTHCAPERYWSHRRDGTARGLQAAVIVLNEKGEADANEG